MSIINKFKFIKFILLSIFINVAMLINQSTFAEQQFTHIKFDEKIIWDLVLNRTGTIPKKLNYEQEFMLEVSDVLGKILSSNSKIDYRLISAFKNLSPTFKEKVANNAAIDSFANNHSKEEQALAHTIAEFRLTDYEYALAKEITKKQTQQHINISGDINDKISKQILARSSFLIPTFIISETENTIPTEDEINTNFWVSSLRSISKKDKEYNQAGYVGNYTGGIIGLDFSTGEEDILGLAYSYVHSAFKYKSFRTGDKVFADTNVGSVYSSSQFNNINWQNIFSVGFGTVKNIRFDHIFNKNAEAKFKTNGYNVSSVLGYELKLINNYHLKPYVGISYHHSTDGSYTEHGVGTARHLVERRVNSSFVGTVGTKIAVMEYFNNGLTLTPTLNSSIERAFGIKTQKVKAKYIWKNYYYHNKGYSGTHKFDPISFNISADILVKKNNFKINVGYGYNVRRKYHNQQMIIGFELSWF